MVSRWCTYRDNASDDYTHFIRIKTVILSLNFKVNVWAFTELSKVSSMKKKSASSKLTDEHTVWTNVLRQNKEDPAMATKHLIPAPSIFCIYGAGRFWGLKFGVPQLIVVELSFYTNIFRSPTVCSQSIFWEPFVIFWAYHWSQSYYHKWNKNKTACRTI